MRHLTAGTCSIISESRSVVKHKFAENAIFCKSGQRWAVRRRQNDFKWPPLLTGCGSQHPLRALGGTRVLLAAAPTTSPCFRRWRRSSSLLAIFSGKNIFNFGFQESLRTFLKPIFTGGVIEESGRGSKKQNAQVPKNLCVMAGVVSFELTARGFGDRCSTS